MKDIIISAGVDGRDRYSEIVKGLERSLIEANWHGDVRIYKEFPEWCTPHNKVPYAFKYDLIQRSIEEGYSRVFWLDSVMRLVPGKNISDLLDQSAEGIVAFHNIGHNLIHYCNDSAAKYMEIDNLDGIFQCWGGALFFDFNKETAKSVFYSVMVAATVGAFNDDQTNRKDFVQHRHDQAVVSGYLHKFHVPLVPYGIIAAPKDVTEKTYIRYGDN